MGRGMKCSIPEMEIPWAGGNSLFQLAPPRFSVRGIGEYRLGVMREGKTEIWQC